MGEKQASECLVSIIIPIYNVQNYLVECIESVLHQTHKNIEIILVDDGSPDECAAICDAYLLADSRVTVIHKQNGGLSSARNYGLDMCKGEYVFFADSDDAINHHTIEQMLNTTFLTGADVVQGKGLVLSDGIAKDERPEESYTVYSPMEYLSLLFARKGKNDTRIVAMNKLYSRNLFLKERFADGIIHEDEELIPRVLYRANKVCILDARLYYYRIVQGSIMHSSFSEKRYDMIQAKQSNIAFFTEKGEKALLNEYITTYLFDLFNLYYKTIEYSFPAERLQQIKAEIRRYFWRSLRCADVSDKLRLLKNRLKMLAMSL